MDTLNADGTWDRLGSIALLLHQAANQVWSDADRAAADSPLHDLGLGVYLAHSQASALLPDDYELPDVDADEELEERTPLQLLTEAEELTRPLPLHDLGLGVYLAHSQASALLPDDYELPDVDADEELEERTPLQLLTEAEELTRPLPLHRPDLVHGSQLVVDLCDLIREARGLGY